MKACILTFVWGGGIWLVIFADSNPMIIIGPLETGVLWSQDVESLGITE